MALFPIFLSFAWKSRLSFLLTWAPCPDPASSPVSPQESFTVPEGAGGVDFGPEKVEGNRVFLFPFLKEGVLRPPSHLFPMSTSGLQQRAEKKRDLGPAPRSGSKTGALWKRVPLPPFNNRPASCNHSPLYSSVCLCGASNRGHADPP